LTDTTPFGLFLSNRLPQKRSGSSLFSIFISTIN
jgi:hypothetical protein